MIIVLRAVLAAFECFTIGTEKAPVAAEGAIADMNNPSPMVGIKRERQRIPIA
jgi:hypothetical protein